MAMTPTTPPFCRSWRRIKRYKPKAEGKVKDKIIINLLNLNTDCCCWLLVSIHIYIRKWLRADWCAYWWLANGISFFFLPFAPRIQSFYFTTSYGRWISTSHSLLMLMRTSTSGLLLDVFYVRIAVSCVWWDERGIRVNGPCVSGLPLRMAFAMN